MPHSAQAGVAGSGTRCPLVLRPSPSPCPSVRPAGGQPLTPPRRWPLPCSGHTWVGPPGPERKCNSRTSALPGRTRQGCSVERARGLQVLVSASMGPAGSHLGSPKAQASLVAPGPGLVRAPAQPWQPPSGPRLHPTLESGAPATSQDRPLPATDLAGACPPWSATSGSSASVFYLSRPVPCPTPPLSCHPAWLCPAPLACVSGQGRDSASPTHRVAGAAA